MSRPVADADRAAPTSSPSILIRETIAQASSCNEAGASLPATSLDRTNAYFHAAATNTGATPRRAADAHHEETPITDASARTHVGPASKLDTAILQTQAKAALTALGWKPAIAHAAVAAAVAETSSTTLERLVFEALRRCRSIR
jgi:hypothetical protein